MLASLATVLTAFASGIPAFEPTTAPWQWQLEGRVDTTVSAPIYDLDGDGAPAAAIARLERRGVQTVCYVDVGSWEDFRADAGRFPRRLRGRAYEGFDNERWLDIRAIDALAPLLRARFETCRRKGFDAVEPDNLEGYRNRTGFPLTAADQLRFNRWVADEVHSRGMAVALKNDGAQAAALEPAFDFAIVESCFTYGECDPYRVFTRGGKAVLVAEYRRITPRTCARARVLRFSLIEKRLALTRFRRTCP